MNSVPVLKNQLILALPEAEQAKILGACEETGLVPGEILHEAGHPLKYVHFPLSGFISLVTTLPHDECLDVGLIGSEGMLGSSLVLGVRTAPLRALVQGSGIALRMGAARFQTLLRRSPALLDLVKRYLYAQMEQFSQASACIHFHLVEARLARWLLMTQDRVNADHFHLTHAFLADMLGVRRSAVTISAGVLQQRKIIRYSRGEIFVRDRAALEATACGCYQRGLDEYTRVLRAGGNPQAG